MNMQCTLMWADIQLILYVLGGPGVFLLLTVLGVEDCRRLDRSQD